MACIDPLNPTGHPDELYNFVTGQIANTITNVHNALELGKQSMETYKQRLPERFYSQVSCPVTMMRTKWKVKLQEGIKPIFDTAVKC